VRGHAESATSCLLKFLPVNLVQEIIQRHIELEIMLRLRTLEAANAKIHWAEAMRQAIVEGVSQQTCESGDARVIDPPLIH
jgi:hypothetical protein